MTSLFGFKANLPGYHSGLLSIDRLISIRHDYRNPKTKNHPANSAAEWFVFKAIAPKTIRGCRTEGNK
jgi:hypothetical protein